MIRFAATAGHRSHPGQGICEISVRKSPNDRARSRAVYCKHNGGRKFSYVFLKMIHRFGAQWRVNEGRKGHQLSALRANSLRIRTGNFLRPCRELNRTIREIFPLIRESALVRFFGICFADKCDRPDRPRLCGEGEEGAARCSKPPKPISRSKPAFCPGERHARAFPEIWSPSSSTRTNGVSGFAMAASVLSLAARLTELDRSRGNRTPIGHAHDAAGCI
jgi:hypothetical protein